MAQWTERRPGKPENVISKLTREVFFLSISLMYIIKVFLLQFFYKKVLMSSTKQVDEGSQKIIFAFFRFIYICPSFPHSKSNISKFNSTNRGYKYYIFQLKFSLLCYYYYSLIIHPHQRSRTKIRRG